MTIEQRLERLERRANRYRNALVLLVMGLVVGCVGPANAVVNARVSRESHFVT